VRASIALLLLLACQPPSSSADVVASVATGVVVIEATAPDGEPGTWEARAKYGSVVPSGEYLLFRSTTPPTSVEELATFDPSPCLMRRYATNDQRCALPGLGEYFGRAQLSQAGEPTFEPFYSGETEARVYFSLVRRGSPIATADVTMHIEYGGDGGCGNPDPPILRAFPGPT
jgi:hypothetical protein